MNTTMDKVVSDGKRISAIECYQMTTETRYRMTAEVYIDATGHGTLGYFGGAEYRIGREDRHEFGEKDAPEIPDGETMGNTIIFAPETRATQSVLSNQTGHTALMRAFSSIGITAMWWYIMMQKT